jgi:Mn2+/Fe2+ NRAMP family transporter
VVSVSGAVLHSWTGLWSLEGFALTILGVVIALLFTGGFRWLDHLNKVMMGILALATVLAFLPVLPDVPLAEAGRGLVAPAIPAGSVVLVAALLGWMPTGIDVSIWHSFWTLEKLDSLGEGTQRATAADRLRQLRMALMDMRVGYGLSLGTGVMFLCLGAVHLVGRGAELQGVQFVQTLSDAYTVILGRWMFHVFMLTAFFAMFSTSYTVIDGFSRSFSEALAALWPRLAEAGSRRRSYGGFVLFSAALACLSIAVIGNPVTLVTIVALVSLAAAPVLYGLNLRCVGRDIDDPALRPSRWVVALGWAGILVMVVALVLTVQVKLLS